MAAREQLIDALVEFGFSPSGGPRRVTEETVARFVERLKPVTAPDFTCSMVGDEGASFVGRFEGLDGFEEAWRDWLDTFDWLDLQSDQELIETDDKVVALGGQRGRSARAGVEVENDAAAVWTIQGDRLASVEFHLSRDAAMRAAGLDPG